VRRFLEIVLPIAVVACGSAPPTIVPAVPGAEAERRDVKPGGQYVFGCTHGMKTYHSRIVITAVDETSTRYTSNGTPLETTREGNPLRNKRFSHSNYRVLGFPPEVEKTGHSTMPGWGLIGVIAAPKKET